MNTIPGRPALPLAAFQFSAEKWSFAGWFTAIAAFDYGNFPGAVYIVGASFWTLESLYCFWCLKDVSAAEERGGVGSREDTPLAWAGGGGAVLSVPTMTPCSSLACRRTSSSEAGAAWSRPSRRQPLPPSAPRRGSETALGCCLTCLLPNRYL